MSLDRPSGSGPQGSSHEVVGTSGADATGNPFTGISDEMLQLYATAFGRGAARVRTYIQPEFCVCVLGDILTSAERSRVRNDGGAEVEAARGMIARALDADFVDIVERQTGRAVLNHQARINPKAGLAVHFFLFADVSARSDVLHD